MIKEDGAAGGEGGDDDLYSEFTISGVGLDHLVEEDKNEKQRVDERLLKAQKAYDQAQNYAKPKRRGGGGGS